MRDHATQAGAETPARSYERKRLWHDIEELVSRHFVDVPGLVAHGLGPFAASLLEARGERLPAVLAERQRFVRLAALTAPAVLERVRAGSDGPLLLLKGPEVAARYPSRARSFADLDLLVPDDGAVQRALLAAGFQEEDDPQGLFVGIHHLPPIRWSGMLLAIELHHAPKWPDGISPPSVEELLERAVPSATGVEGVLAPDPAAHAVLLAAHAWSHQPLATMRDLIDVGALSAEANVAETRALAGRWGVGRIFDTMMQALEAALDGRRTIPLRTWAGHVAEVREQVVREQHLERLLAPFWGLPPALAVRRAAAALRAEFRPAFDETWGEKISRTAAALRRSSEPVSTHDRLLGTSATRGRGRNVA